MKIVLELAVQVLNPPEYDGKLVQVYCFKMESYCHMSIRSIGYPFQSYSTRNMHCITYSTTVH